MKLSFSSIKKTLLRAFMPSARTLAEFAAGRLASSVNESGKEDAISKWATVADSFLGLSKKLSSALRDGKVDPEEQAALARMLEPPFETLRKAMLK